ncbi:hypothetical protein IFT59_01955 [Rhizobium sp. CFBP 8752]|uniref:hypothetical protein n=1 Tax=Rhizobium sp. CFBP 8752 TaxID=2775301 RepID=UPI0017854A5D|nr:hypothetical protein [Rhizobium sp. CFBP 8752]MBD8662004.1 hypothetical protein [Rhizobium sp. CFBP 8752]
MILSERPFFSRALFLATCLATLTVAVESGRSGQPAGSLVEGMALAAASGESLGVLILGIDADKAFALKSLSSSTIDGALDKFRLGEGGFVGANLSKQLSIKPGDFITLVHPTGDSTPFGPMPLVVRYRVLGVVDSPLMSAAAETVYIRTTDAKKFVMTDATATP